jgi:2-methylcitrate dehydratase PrpD
MPKTPPPITTRFAEFAAGLDPAHLPPEAVARAKLAILDTLGIALASTGYDFAHRTASGVAALGGPGESPVIGLGMKLPLRDAVLLNATLAHGLDFDDTHTSSTSHCSASAVPLVLGMSLATRASGARAIAAYLLAVEVTARIGAAARGTLQKRGWHPTGIIGTFGCAAAASYLLDLPPPQFAHALGVAYSVTSGNFEFVADGAWTKRMHPGWAGVGGITAAHLAKGGFVGPGRPLEGRFGLFNLLLGADFPVDLEAVTAKLGAPFEVMNIAMKPYPACHFIHAFADCALALRERYGLTASSIAGIKALIHPDPVNVVCEPEAAKRRPGNAYEAQFSVHYVVAASLVRGRFGLGELDDAALANQEILDLAARVGYGHDPESAFPAAYSGALEVTLHDGRVLKHREQINRGAADNPLSDAEVHAKFFDNATRAVSRARAERILALVETLDTAPDLTALGAALAG